MADIPPILLGERIRDDVTRRSVEAFYSSLLKSGVFEKSIVVPIGWGGQRTFNEFDRSEADESVTSEIYGPNATGISVEVQVVDGEEWDVYVTAGCTVEAAAASNAWLSLYDASSTLCQAMSTLPGADAAENLTVGYTERLTASKTFTLRLRKNAGGDAAFISYERWMAVIAHRREPETYAVPVHWRDLAMGRMVLRRVRLVSSIDIRDVSGENHVVRVVVAQGDRREVLASWEGRTGRLNAGESMLMGGRDLDYRLGKDDVCMIVVERTGDPESLFGVSAEWVFGLVGA